MGTQPYWENEVPERFMGYSDTIWIMECHNDQHGIISSNKYFTSSKAISIMYYLRVFTKHHELLVCEHASDGLDDIFTFFGSLLNFSSKEQRTSCHHLKKEVNFVSIIHDIYHIDVKIQNEMYSQQEGYFKLNISNLQVIYIFEILTISLKRLNFHFC